MWLSTDPALGEYIPGLDKDKNKNLPGMGGLFNQINANLFHAFGNNPITYTDPDGRETKEERARSILYESAFFIITNAETEREKLIANSVKEMMDNKKVQLDNILNRYERADFPQNERKAYFDVYRNTETGEPRNIIVIDIDFILREDVGETIEALAHEAWHKVQYDRGSVFITEDNTLSVNYANDGRSLYDHFTDYECDAYNMGLAMHNKYRKKQNLEIFNWYRWNDIRALYPED